MIHNFMRGEVLWTLDYEVNKISFNEGHGFCSVNGGMTNSTLGDDLPLRQWLRFSTRSRPSSTSTARPPAWEYEAPYSATWSSSNRPSPREMQGLKIGFIQVVDRLEFTAQYENLPQHTTVTVTERLDRNPHTQDASDPWYNASGNSGGPTPLFDTSSSSLAPDIQDSPEISLPNIRWSDGTRYPLRTVTCRGTFLIWLLIKHDDDQAIRRNVEIVHNLGVEINMQWRFANDPSGTSSDPSEGNFIAGGHLREIAGSVGPGPRIDSIKLQNPYAFEGLRSHMITIQQQVQNERQAQQQARRP